MEGRVISEDPDVMMKINTEDFQMVRVIIYKEADGRRNGIFIEKADDTRGQGLNQGIMKELFCQRKIIEINKRNVAVEAAKGSRIELLAGDKQSMAGMILQNIENLSALLHSVKAALNNTGHIGIVSSFQNIFQGGRIEEPDGNQAGILKGLMLHFQ